MASLLPLGLIFATAVGIDILFAGFTAKVLPLPHSGEAIIAPQLTAEQDCSGGRPSSEKIAESQLLELRKLAEYDAVCEGAPIQQLMLFAPMPFTPTEAPELAGDMAARLRQMDTAAVPPLIIFEPSKNGVPMDFAAMRHGHYDTALQVYFRTLRERGITDSMMGTWVPLPEANTPVWGVTDPQLFAANITKIATLQKQYFPGSHTSMLLNSQSYSSHDTTWAHGSFASLLPYVRHIPKGLIDSLGYQGFPWTSPANQPDGPTLMDASWFIKPDLAIAAAKELGVSSIWLNTGTFSRLYANQPGMQVNQTPAMRQQTLADITAQAEKIQKAGFTVAINLFAANKAATNERTDWSYWSDGRAAKSTATPVFRRFAHNVQQKHIALWLYDAPQ